MHQVQCKNKECTAVAMVDGDTDVHSAIDAAGCRCCPQDHHHGQATALTGQACRPLIIRMLAGSITTTPAG